MTAEGHYQVASFCWKEIRNRREIEKDKDWTRDAARGRGDGLPSYLADLCVGLSAHELDYYLGQKSDLVISYT